jgi:hypothetical protein
VKAIPDTLRGDSDYQDGYKEGREVYLAAMAVARERLGAPPPSILRVAKDDLERQADLKMFEDIEVIANENVDPGKVRIGAQEFALPCTCHLMEGGKKCAGCLAEMEKMFDA